MYRGSQPEGEAVGKGVRDRRVRMDVFEWFVLVLVLVVVMAVFGEVMDAKRLSRARKKRYEGVATEWRISTLLDGE